MRTYSLIAFSSTVITAFFLIGCAQVPERNLKAAKASLDSARMAEADKYAAGDFKTAKESIDSAIAEIEKKNYKKAEALLVSAAGTANNAKLNAAQGKMQAASEANTAISGANALLTEVKKSIAKSPRGMRGLSVIKNEFDAAAAMLQEAQSANNNGDYLAAGQQANTCLVKLLSIKNEVNGAKTVKPTRVK